MTIKSLQAQLSQVSDRKTKNWREAYMKHSLPFRGLELPQVRAVLHDWVVTENFIEAPWIS